MSLQNRPFVHYPWQDYPSLGGDGSFDFMSSIADGDAGGYIIPVPTSGNLVKIHLFGSAGGTAEVTLQNLDYQGWPDGTVLATGELSDSSNAWHSIELDEPLAVARGRLVAVVVEPDESGGGSLAFGRSNTAKNCRVVRRVNGSWTTLTDGEPDKSPVLIFEYEGGTIVPIPGVATVEHASAEIGAGGNPDEVALRFKLPFPARCCGIGFYGLPNQSDSETYELILYSGTTSLGVFSAPGPYGGGTNLGTQIGFFDAVDLQPNTVYRAAIKPTSIGSISFHYVTEQQNSSIADHMESLLGGKEFYWSERLNAGSWSDTPRKRPAIFLILEAFHDSRSLWLFDEAAGTVTAYKG